jgi:hypothetical protein
MVELILLCQLLLDQLLLVHQSLGVFATLSTILKAGVHKQELVATTHRCLKVVLEVLIIRIISSQVIVSLL